VTIWKLSGDISSVSVKYVLFARYSQVISTFSGLKCTPFGPSIHRAQSVEGFAHQFQHVQCRQTSAAWLELLVDCRAFPLDISGYLEIPWQLNKSPLPSTKLCHVVARSLTFLTEDDRESALRSAITGYIRGVNGPGRDESAW
jgi:hypothetical protein